MCIFSKDVVASKTKILNCDLEDGKRFTAYQNEVTSNEVSFMMLPVPAKTEPTFIDTRGFNGFLNELAEKVGRKENEGMRGIYQSKSVEFNRVGQYQVHFAKTEDVQGILLSEKQPIYSWWYDFEKKYQDWYFLLCKVDAGAKQGMQPIGYEYETMDGIDMFCPMNDIHGNGKVEDRVDRDHIVMFGSSRYTWFDLQTPNFPYPHLKFSGMSVNGYKANGDLYMYHNEDRTKLNRNDWK